MHIDPSIEQGIAAVFDAGARVAGRRLAWIGIDILIAPEAGCYRPQAGLTVYLDAAADIWPLKAHSGAGDLAPCLGPVELGDIDIAPQAGRDALRALAASIASEWSDASDLALDLAGTPRAGEALPAGLWTFHASAYGFVLMPSLGHPRLDAIESQACAAPGGADGDILRRRALWVDLRLPAPRTAHERINHAHALGRAHGEIAALRAARERLRPAPGPALADPAQREGPDHPPSSGHADGQAPRAARAAP